MFGIKELDIRNTYNPNLQNIQESAERTYGEANVFFEMLEKYLKDLEIKIDGYSDKVIYDISNAIASELAKCCELYLKALYIYENNIDGNNIDDIWRELKTSVYKTDSNGNPVYLLEKNENKIYTYVKTDEKSVKILDSNGQNMYVDDNNNVYPEGQQGKKIKLNGHQLDRLIDNLSMESRLLLEKRMLNIPMSNTEMYDSVSVYDVLKKNGIIYGSKQMSSYEFESWIDLHKKTFEETRYAGQKKYNINLEFLYHLTKQIKTVAQYKIKPNENQKFTINMKEKKIDNADFIKILEELEDNIWNDIKLEVDECKNENYLVFPDDFKYVPPEILTLLQYDDFGLISNNLFDLVTKNLDAKQKLVFIIDNYKYFLKDMNSKSLYKLLIFCDI